MPFRVSINSSLLLIWAFAASLAQAGAQMGRGLRGSAAPVNGSCHDTVEGESCYTAVAWAMHYGIVLHPEWYPGLHVGSSFGEFQKHLRQVGHGGCMEPCDLCRTAQPGDQCHTAVIFAMDHGINLHPEQYDNLTAGATFEEFQRLLHRAGIAGCPWPCPTCHTALPSEECYTGVVWAMEHGIHMHPEWYTGLTADSSFVDFQEYLHNTRQSRCPYPCGHCHTSLVGEVCFEGMTLAMELLIKIHPEWYPELTPQSSFEDVQAHLHEGGFNQCPEPCK